MLNLRGQGESHTEISWRPFSLELRTERSAGVCDLEIVRLEGVLSPGASMRSLLSVWSKIKARTETEPRGRPALKKCFRVGALRNKTEIGQTGRRRARRGWCHRNCEGVNVYLAFAFNFCHRCERLTENL